MADCICTNCKRVMDCGSQTLCDVCEADQASIARMAAVGNQGILNDAAQRKFGPGMEPTEGNYVVLSRDGKVRSEVICKGHVRAVELLSPGEFERIALVVDIPR